MFLIIVFLSETIKVAIIGQSSEEKERNYSALLNVEVCLSRYMHV